MEAVMEVRQGQYDTRYLAFLETISGLRPKLHLYCARMTGSAMDGEDVVQEALLQAYLKLDSFDVSRPLKPWLFRIAHNRCIDFLRRKGVRMEAESAAASDDFTGPADPLLARVDHAVERLVSALPPKERACVLLKDVFDYSLEEIAELVDSTTGGVKAALSRGRGKLAKPQEPAGDSGRIAPAVLQLYVDRFNRRDWDGVRDLITADARIRVVDRFEGPLADAPYFGRYERMTYTWKWVIGEVEAEPALIVLRMQDDAWIPYGVARVGIVNGQIARLTDYSHCPWVLEDSRVSPPACAA
jgi:RNA polymerase sigma-70 factor (ECF subfamily)